MEWGGHAGGSVTSRITLEFFAQNASSLHSAGDIVDLIQRAHLELAKYGEEKPEYVGLGTTIAGLLVSESTIIVFNVGDSRVYRVNSGYLEQLSRDQSFVQALIEQGVISEEEARYHPKRHVILEAIGGGGDKKMVSVVCRELRLREENTFLICSDGLTDSFSVEGLESCLREDFRETMESIFTRVLKEQVDDDVSVILVSMRKEKRNA